MDRWVWYAIVSMIFAGATSVVAKQGLAGISGELGLAVRTIFVSLFVFGFAVFAVPREHWFTLTKTNLFWLGLSGLTTAVSWVFYYKALKLGDVASVALIDKGSVVIAIALAWLLLGERISWRMAIGAGLIVTGIVVLSRK